MRTLGLIPARGGSKRLPRKNILPLGGKPLIAWTIELALQCKALDQVVVSTEDAEIAAVARQYGAEVLDRPAELARDTTEMIEVMNHALFVYPADVLVLLQPTSPYRTEDDITDCLNAVHWGFSAAITSTSGTHWNSGTNGLVYAWKRRQIESGTLYPFGRMAVFQTAPERSIDIDTAEDFARAEEYLRVRTR